MPDLVLLPSRKRADARRRGAMLVQLAADMRRQLAVLLNQPAVALGGHLAPLCAGVS